MSRTHAAEPAITAALVAAGLCREVRDLSSCSGGCIHQVLEIRLGDGGHVIAKVNHDSNLRLFQEEMQGLHALQATQTVLVPRPLAVLAHGGFAVLLMTRIESAKPHADAWEQFGRDLAALHAAPVSSSGHYGFATDNHLGSTPQPNTWCDDWVEFNRVHRLGFQLKRACDGGLLERAEAGAIERVIEGLDRLIPHRPYPSLLHGDLWSGNALITVRREGPGAHGPTGALIDPACSCGDSLADIAMMELFGGFPEACYRAYEDAAARRLNDHAVRTAIGVYQLYHVLNHVNIFGRGYAGQALSLAQRLLTGLPTR